MAHSHLNERKTGRWVDDPLLGKVAIPRRAGEILCVAGFEDTISRATIKRVPTFTAPLPDYRLDYD
jgi:hypothetical protein